jgi:hypothetical protein
MNCRKFETLLDTQFNRDTSRDTALEMQHHASTCQRCRSLQLQWEQISRAAQQLPRCSAPDSFETQLMRRIHAQEHRKFRYYWFNLPRPMVQAAAYSLVFLAVGISVLLMPGKQSPEIPASVANRTSESTPFQRLDTPMPALVQSASRAAVEELEGGIRIGRPATTPLPVLFGEFSSQADREYVDYLLKGTGNREVFVRVPRVIRYQAPANDDTFYVHNISH